MPSIQGPSGEVDARLDGDQAPAESREVLRAHIQELEKKLDNARAAWGQWEKRAQAAELQRDQAVAALNKVLETIRKNMIWKPIDYFQWGYRTALISILDVIRPEGVEEEGSCG